MANVGFRSHGHQLFLAMFFTTTVVFLTHGKAMARVPLFPNGDWALGEYGVLMAGAQVALAGGAEAAWYNPAGMAKETRNGWSLSGMGLQAAATEIGVAGEPVLLPTTANFSYVSAPVATRKKARFNYGFYYGWPSNRQVSARFSATGTTDQTALPGSLRGTSDLDGLFPEGITRTEDTLGAGGLRVLQVGFGFGASPGEGFRLGGAVLWERVNLWEQSESLVTFSAEGGAGGADVLKGWVDGSTQLQGEAERLVYQAGIQWDFARGSTLGISLRFPSEQQRGLGSVFSTRMQKLTVTSGGTAWLDGSNYSRIDQSEVAFQLHTPRELRVGVALVFDSLAVELDAIQRSALEPYDVFPAAQSGPSSTIASRIGPYSTSLHPVTRYALGVALTQAGGGSFLFGLARDSSGVPEDDPVFRRVDLDTLTMGYASARGALSVSAGVVYQVGQAFGTTLPNLAGGPGVPGNLKYDSTGIVGGVSYLF